MDKLIRDPETITRLDAISQARREFMELYTRKEEMLVIERNIIYLRYVKLLGRLQYERYQLGVDVRALKMKIKLAQEALSRRQRPDIDAIDATVSRALADDLSEVSRQAKALRDAASMTMPDQDELIELRDLYRLMVKKLHPDLNPAQSDRDYDLFLKGQSAYRTMNVEALRHVIVNIDVTAPDGDPRSRGENLDHTLWRLRSQIALFTTAISELSLTFPFDQADILSNAQLLDRRRSLLSADIDSLRAERDVLTDRLTLFL